MPGTCESCWARDWTCVDSIDPSYSSDNAKSLITRPPGNSKCIFNKQGNIDICGYPTLCIKCMTVNKLYKYLLILSFFFSHFIISKIGLLQWMAFIDEDLCVHTWSELFIMFSLELCKVHCTAGILQVEFNHYLKCL